jgi:hypothetical protein
MSINRIHNILELIISITFLAGVVTAALNLSFAGFTPMIRFLNSIQAVIITICTEISVLRERYVGKKYKEVVYCSDKLTRLFKVNDIIAVRHNVADGILRLQNMAVTLEPSPWKYLQQCRFDRTRHNSVW